MIFRPALAQAILEGRKTVTRRLTRDNPRSPWWRERCGFRVGQSFAVCPGRSKHAIGRAVVTAVHMEMLGHLTEDEARREGFASIAEFFDAFRGINGSKINGWDSVWRIEFELEQPTEVAA